VRSDYVEKPDDSKLIESAINGMLTGLDPHSSYMDAKSFREMQVETRGESRAIHLRPVQRWNKQRPNSISLDGSALSKDRENA
jgi:carboxyl-terminal processing protease